MNSTSIVIVIAITFFTIVIITTIFTISNNITNRIFVRTSRDLHREVTGNTSEVNPPARLKARYPSSTLFPFLIWDLLSKAEHSEKGCPYYYGVTGETKASHSQFARTCNGQIRIVSGDILDIYRTCTVSSKHGTSKVPLVDHLDRKDREDPKNRPTW